MLDNHICLYRECTEILMQSIESGHTPRDIENATRHVRQILDNEDYLRRDDLLNRRLGGVITEDELDELHKLERQYPSMKYVVTVQSVAKAVRFAYDEGFSDGGMVDIKKSAQLFEDRAAICGNFDPVSVMLLRTPQTVRAAVIDCLQNGGSRLLSGAGCEIPEETPDENLFAQHQALVEQSGVE